MMERQPALQEGQARRVSVNKERFRFIQGLFISALFVYFCNG
jgi:hypothetical protein